MSKHTKGPWIAEFTVPEEGWNGFYILTKDERLYIADAAGYQDMPERAANARLIAAAPDLLEAAEAALNLLETKSAYWLLPPTSDCWRNQLRAAIAKARGEVTP